MTFFFYFFRIYLFVGYRLRKLSSNVEAGICWPKPTYGPMETHRSEMMNGIKIIAAKTSGAVMTACTIMFQAGSRYESSEYLGATHFLRAASIGSGNCTAFAKLRVLQQHGAYLTCTSDRQTIAYTLICPWNYFSKLKYYLLDTAVRCCYHNWEISDYKSIIRGDLTRINPEERVLDLIQKAFWAGSLSNSIFCEEDRIDDMSGAILKSYVDENFKSTSCCLASFGVPFEETLQLADQIYARKDKPAIKELVPSRPRSGFEYNDLGAGSDTWIAMAVPGCGTDDLINLYKHGIVASACGSGNMQDGQHELDRIPQPPLGLMLGDVFTNIRAFNISYADSGIFGLIAKTNSENACRTAYCVSEFLANIGDLDFKHIKHGKKRMQLSLAIHEEDCVKVVEGLALQLANNTQIIDNVEESIKIMDTISIDEIKATACSLSARRKEMAVAVVGDIAVVPSDQELFNR